VNTGARRRRRQSGASALAIAVRKTVLAGASVYGAWDARRNVTLVSGGVSSWGKVVTGECPDFAQGTASLRPGVNANSIVPDQVDDYLRTGPFYFLTNDIMFIVVYEHAFHGSSGRRLIGLGPAGQNGLLVSIDGGNGIIRVMAAGLTTVTTPGGAAGAIRALFVSRDAVAGAAAVALTVRRGSVAEVVGPGGTPTYGDVQVTLFASNDAAVTDGSYHKVRFVAVLRSVNGNNRAAIQTAWMPFLSSLGADLT
jgi:hypothetical protein